MKAGSISRTAQLEARLAKLEAQNAALRTELARITRRANPSPLRTLEPDFEVLSSSSAELAPTVVPDAPSGDEMTSRQKIARFRERFAGRDDLFAQLWESRDGARRGYAPVCSNECRGCARSRR